MTKIRWSDGLESGGRTPRLVLIGSDGTGHRFAGPSIPGVAVVTTSEHTKNGKWSHTLWTLALAEGARAFPLLSRLHGMWGDEYTTWAEVAQHFGVSREEAKRIVGLTYKKVGERLDAVEAELAALGEADTAKPSEEGVWACLVKTQRGDLRFYPSHEEDEVGTRAEALECVRLSSGTVEQPRVVRVLDDSELEAAVAEARAAGFAEALDKVHDALKDLEKSIGTSPALDAASEAVDLVWGRSRKVPS